MSVEDTDFDYGALIAESEVDDEALLEFDPAADELEAVEAELGDADGITDDAADPEAIAPPPEEGGDDAIEEPETSEEIEIEEPAEQDLPESVRALDPVGSPVVAVCGLNGGAGTSTFTMLLAYAAAQQNRGPVLLTDLGGPSASIAAYLSKRGAHSLASAANAHRAGLLGADGRMPFAQLPNGLRLMAREPGLADDVIGDPDDPFVYDLLIDAQEDHFATFVDCGRLEQPGEMSVAEHATHIIWVVDGNPAAIRRARAALNALSYRGSRSSILVVRVDETAPLSDSTEKGIRLAADAADADMIMCPVAGDVVEQGLGQTARRAIQPVKAALGRIWK